MTIVAVEPIVVTLPFTNGRPPAGLGARTWTTLDYLLVRLTDSDGSVGYGEGFGYGAIPATRAALETLVAPLVVGADASDVSALYDRLTRALHLYGRSGPVAFAVAAVDIAAWDLAGKRAGQPVYELLGGQRRESVAAYASALHLGEPELVAAETRAVVDRGLRGLKLHETAPDCVLAARQAAPALELMLDVNCAWTLAEAQTRLDALEPLGLAWIEEPIWPPEDASTLGALRGTISIPMAAGENATTVAEAEALSTVGCCDFVQPSVTKVGITGFTRMADAAVAHGARIAPHSPYLGPGLLATLQLAAVYPDMAWVEWLWADPEARIYDSGSDHPTPQGELFISSEPGLGADPDPAVLAHYRVA